jgi:SAM-dependent methyltransferase
MSATAVYDVVPRACALCHTEDHNVVIVNGADKRLIRCRACSVVFLDPMPEEQFVKEEFEDRHIKDDGRLEHFFGANRDPVLAAAARQVKKHKRAGAILDVGCAGGRFLSQFFRDGDWEKWGVEPSSFAATRAVENGITVLRGELGNVELPESKFDVITVIGVLLYFRRPFEDLLKLRNALRPGGILIVELPLAEAQLWRNSNTWFRVAAKPRSLLGSGHLYYYNLRSLDFLLQRAGFKTIHQSPVPAMRQINAYRRAVASLYGVTSRSVWELSGQRLMCGPDFLTISIRA